MTSAQQHTPKGGKVRPSWIEAYFIGKHYARRAKLPVRSEYDEIAREIGSSAQQARMACLIALGHFVFAMHRWFEQRGFDSNYFKEHGFD